MFNLFHYCTRSLGPFPDNIHAPRQWTRPQLSSHSADPTSASSTTFPPFHASLPIQVQRPPPDRSTASPESPTPTTDNPIPPAISLFRDICFIEWLYLYQILSIDSLHPYFSILESSIAVLITVHVFLRSPPWPAVQLPPPTAVSLRHPRRVSWPSP